MRHILTPFDPIINAVDRLFENALIKTLIAVVVVWLGWLSQSGAEQWIARLIILDWVTGLTKATLDRRWSSKATAEGIVKTTVYAFILWLGPDVAKSFNGADFFYQWLLVAMAFDQVVSNLENADEILDQVGTKWPSTRPWADALQKYIHPVVQFLERKKKAHQVSLEGDNGGLNGNA